MTRIGRLLISVVVIPGVLGAGGCGGGEPAAPAVCDSLTAVRTTVEHIRQANVSENGLSALRPYVSQLLDELNQLVLDAKAQFGVQADQLRAAVDQLRTDVGTARSGPTVTTLSAVRTSVQAVGAGARTLGDAMRQTC